MTSMTAVRQFWRIWGIDMDFPKNIKDKIDGLSFTKDNIGMSGSEIYIFDDMILKVERHTKSVDKMIDMLTWLEGKVLAPKVICYEVMDDKSYILMTKIKGKMACDEYYLENPKILLKLLADALKSLWAVDISDCPRTRDIDQELKEARYRVENNLVDTDNCEPDTFSEKGFKSPEGLLLWLENNRPTYEPCLSHGDFCLPNVFFENDKLSGFIDLGDAGIGDKWRDIALLYRSLKHNFDGTFGGKVYPDFNPDMLFEALGIEPDFEKLRYYTLLDELF